MSTPDKRQKPEENSVDSILAAASQRILMLEAALVAANGVLETAMLYFPKSIRNSDRFHLENVLANVVRPAIDKCAATAHR